LKSGRLVTPFPIAHSDSSRVMLSARRDFVRSQAFREFRTWIKEESSKFMDEQNAFADQISLQLI
jgi:DNA-binding transcriptional LysR family regulator